MISKENAEHYQWGDNCHGWHLVKSANLSVIQELMPPSASEVRHYHRNAEQFFFILSGTATIEIKGINHELPPESGIHVPPNTPHQMKNCGKTDLVFTVTSTPPSHGDRVELTR